MTWGQVVVAPPAIDCQPEYEAMKQKFPACGEPGRMSNVVYKRSWRELFFSREPIWTKEGELKQENQGRGGFWKPPQPRKSIQVAFGTIFLMISSAAWKTLLGFPPLPQARRRRLLKP